MSTFEPAPSCDGFPSFRALFEPEPRYLRLLHLPGNDDPFGDVRAALAQSRDPEGEVAALLGERNWRPQLVGAIALLASGQKGSARLASVWRALDEGSWAAPQLAACAWLLDPDFEEQARTRLMKPATWPKVAGALGRLYRRLPAPRLQVLARLADRSLLTDAEARDGDRYAAEWLEKLVPWVSTA